MPSDEAMKAAHELFVMSGLEPMANYLDRMMAQARADEAKWWRTHRNTDQEEIERLAELERFAGREK